jgi:hypothetical protein
MMNLVLDEKTNENRERVCQRVKKREIQLE